ncbi:MAG TPA: hypothetical protein VJC07_04015 [Candidatus Nanoarchaeia archaeon]|nr:hypothetical protein [Candidatus Nanoarchaeia archaeon]
MKQGVITAIVVIALVLIVFQSVQISNIKNSVGGNAVKTAVKASSSGGGESYDQMMARMHPDQVRSSASSASPGPSMVGGC